MGKMLELMVAQNFTNELQVLGGKMRFETYEIQ